MSPRKRAFMKVLGAGSRDAPDKNQKHGFCLFILEVNGLCGSNSRRPDSRHYL